MPKYTVNHPLPNKSPEIKMQRRLNRLVLKARTPDGKPLSRQKLEKLVREEFKKRVPADASWANHLLQQFVDVEDEFAIEPEVVEAPNPPSHSSELPMEEEFNGRSR